MLNSDQPLEIQEIKDNSGKLIGYEVKLDHCPELTSYSAKIFYSNPHNIQVSRINGSPEGLKNYHRESGAWISKGESPQPRFFPRDSLEHRAFEMLKEKIDN